MRKVKIIAPYYSGEFTMGRVSIEFHNYWSDKKEEDLLEYLHEVSWSNDFKSSSPTETGSKCRTPFYEIDELEHFTMPNMDSELYYINQDKKEIEFKPYNCHTRYIDHLEDKQSDDDFYPVLIYATTEKGNCGYWLVELEDEEFDTNKFVTSAVDTEFGRFIDAAWYGKSDKELQFDTGEASTITKATSAKIGWVHRDTTNWSKEEVLSDVLKAKNKHVKIESTATIQGLDVSKYLK
jgi:hypothetical protein